MKKILSLVLALALVLAASAAFADVPGNIKDIEGLPEMPEVPTMTTSVSGTTETIVVSEKLNWLNWINNWNWNQIEWSEDGLTGTFSLAGLHSQPGYGNWLSNSGEYVEWTDYWSYKKGEEVYLADYLNKWSNPWGGGGHYHHFDTVKSLNPGWIINYPEVDEYSYIDDEGNEQTGYDVYTGEANYIEDINEENANELLTVVRDLLKELYPDVADEIEGAGFCYEMPDGSEAITHHGDDFSFGTYDLGAKVGWAPVYNGMAFDGEAANGAHVRYDRFGRVISITSTLTGVNFLNMENEPVKTEVTWGVSKTNFGRKFYIASIKAYIDDETAVEAGFASGGKLLKVK